MSTKNNALKSILTTLSSLAALVLVLSACGSSGPERPVANATDEVTSTPRAPDPERSRLIAADFVEAMGQIRELAPHSTSLRVMAPSSRFGEFLIAGLQDAGYDLRLVAAPAAGVLDYHTSVADADSGAYTFFVSAETVRLKRTFRVDSTGVQPEGSMFVHGASAAGIALDTNRFGRPDSFTAPARSAPVAPPRAIAPQNIAVQRPADSVLSPVPPRQEVVRAPLEPTQPLRQATLNDTTNTSTNTSTNIFETGRSRHEETLANYDTVKRHVMVFPNDSLRMGQDNKTLARSILANFDPRHDVLSVIGCSHGSTQIDNGNERLANGRAARVKEEFVRAGLDADLVLEEGCWAGTHFDPMPPRGVVVTHQRRKG